MYYDSLLKICVSIYVLLLCVILARYYMYVETSYCSNIFNKSVISADAKNSYNEPMYSVHYNFPKKTTEVKCKCNKGDIVNKFENIKVRNIIQNTDSQTTKLCQCDKLYENDDIYIYNDTNIKRYMLLNDDKYFNIRAKA